MTNAKIKGSKLVVVDDNQAMLYALAKILRGAGYTVYEASTGEEGLQLVYEHNPHLVLLDVMLPGISGLEVCRKIKTDPQTENTLIVLLSGIHTASDYQIEGLESGADTYIARPVQNRELLARVEALLRIRQAEEDLRASEQLWRTVFAAANDTLLVIDSEGKIVFGNNSATRVYGYSEAELPSISITQLFEEPIDVLAYLAKIDRDLGLIHESTHITKNGSRVFVEISAKPFTVNGVDQYVLSIRDVGERKAAEEQLTYQLNYTSSITNSLAEGLVVYDVGERVTFLNPAAEAMLGWTQEELLGKSFHEVTHYHQPDGSRIPIEECALIVPLTKNEVVTNHEDYFQRKDGAWMPVQCSSAPIYTNQKVSGAVLAFRDITSRKQHENEIKELNAGLERRVLERTAQLEQANKELEAFSYSVSHDLRAPFRHIVGFSELLEKKSIGVLDDNSLRYIKTISDSAKFAGMLVDNLLAFSRIGRTELRTVVVNLEQLVQDVRRAAEYETKDRKIKWKVAPLPQVSGDPILLRLAFENLISNAIKYTRKKPVAEIDIDCREEYNSSTSLPEYIFAIRDNGVGFDPKYVGKLFGVFQRLHRSEEFEGTGIGLANVQRIIHRHNGRVWAESSVGEGATFFVSLPKPID